MRRFFTFLWLSSAACGPSIVRIDPPPLEGASSAIVAIVAADGDVERRLVATEDFAVAFTDDDGAPEAIEVAGLPLDIEALRLAPGRLVEPQTGGAAIGPLAPDPILRTTLDGNSWSTWAPLDELPEALAQTRLPVAGCATPVDEVRARFENTLQVAVAELLDETRALIVVNDEAHLFEEEAGIVRTATLPEIFVGGAIVEKLGKVYLGAGLGNGLYELDVETLQATLTASVSTTEDIGYLRWIDGARDAGGEFLSILASRGQVIRFEDGDFEIVDSVFVRGTGLDFGDVYAAARDRTFIGADHNPSLYAFDGRRLDVEIDGGGDAKGFLGLREVPGLGVVTVEQTSGALFAFDGSRFEQFDRTTSAARVIVPTGARRFVVTDDFGAWREWLGPYGFACDTYASDRLISAQLAFVLGRTVFAVGRGQGGASEVVALARIP